MSSNIATRRTTRTTRTAPSSRDSENALPRTTRTTRAKPPSSSGAAGLPAVPEKPSLPRATAATAASRAKNSGALDGKADAPAKRKREALGEVLVANKAKSGAPTNGKEKVAAVKEKFDGVVIKSKATTVRRPLTTTAGTRKTTRVTTLVATESTIAEVEEETQAVDGPDEHAMAIDPPTAKEATARSPRIPSIAARRSLNARESVTSFARIGDNHRHAARSRAARQQAEDDEEADRAYKKRRTSSEAPDTEAIAALASEDEVAQADADEMLRLYADSEPEMDPETSPWDDLDAEDGDDPAMVSEYVVEIFKYLKDLEHATLPNPRYMDSQKELAWKMRGILTDWLIQVHVRFRLLPETLFLCVNIIDRFLSARVVSLAKLQLVGITCMLIAAKVEEIVAPSVHHFLMCADATYAENEILLAEKYVLKTLDWNLSFPNPVHFLRRVSKADDYNVKVRTLGKYLLEIGCLEWRLLATPPSLLAAAAIWLARLALGMEKWSANLAHYSSYPESALIPTAGLMINYIIKPVRHESFFKKYAGKRFFKSSVYMREWALSRWQEGATVDLAKELPALKAEIRMSRADEEMRLKAEQVDALEMSLAMEGHPDDVDLGPADETITQDHAEVPRAQSFQAEIPKRCKMGAEQPARSKAVRAPLRKL